MPLLETIDIAGAYGQQRIIEHINITLNEGEIVSVLGLSGSGKSTLFHTISGLLEPVEGSVLLKGEDITGKSGMVSYMLQKDLLLPYKTILANVTLPLTLKGVRKKEAAGKVEPFLREFGLDGTQKKYPSELSGGMRQRAALLRTYMCGCEVALLDEPFSALDAFTKASIHDWYMGIMREIRLSTLFITHDIDEAIKLSDRIYILRGRPGQIASEIRLKPEDVRSSELMLSDRFLDYKKKILFEITAQ